MTQITKFNNQYWLTPKLRDSMLSYIGIRHQRFDRDDIENAPTVSKELASSEMGQLMYSSYPVLIIEDL